MKGLEKLLKAIAVLAVIAGVLVVVLRFLEKRREKMDELDAYLMDDDESDVPTAAAVSDEEYLDQDLGEWDSLDDRASVVLSFLVTPGKVEDFQKQLADEGYSSNYDQETQILETVLHGPKSRQEIEEFEIVLKNLLLSTNSTYLGFAFE